MRAQLKSANSQNSLDLKSGNSQGSLDLKSGNSQNSLDTSSVNAANNETKTTTTTSPPPPPTTPKPAAPKQEVSELSARRMVALNASQQPKQTLINTGPIPNPEIGNCAKCNKIVNPKMGFIKNAQLYCKICSFSV